MVVAPDHYERNDPRQSGRLWGRFYGGPESGTHPRTDEVRSATRPYT